MRNTSMWINSLIACLLTFIVMIAIYFAVENATTIDTAFYIILAIVIFAILGNWVTNVILPRGKLRKNVPEEYNKVKSDQKSSLKPGDIAELDYYAKGLSFIVMSLPTLVVVITFICVNVIV